MGLPITACFHARDDHGALANLDGLWLFIMIRKTNFIKILNTSSLMENLKFTNFALFFFQVAKISQNRRF